MANIQVILAALLTFYVGFHLHLRILMYAFVSRSAPTTNNLKGSSSSAESEKKAGTSSTEHLTKEEELFLRAAKSLEPITDKVSRHNYHEMYGRFLLPYYDQNPSVKMLEIGLGCDMRYGPGASVALWKKLFPKAELWIADYDATCVEKHKGEGNLSGINTLVGDQGNDFVLDSWIAESGGNFDVVIDDGGHQNCQIWNSFLRLWPTVKPGGMYFIEDMTPAQLRRFRYYQTDKCDGNLIVPNKLKEFMDDLIYNGRPSHRDVSQLGWADWLYDGIPPHRDASEQGWAVENQVKFIFCQEEACVLGKR